MWRRNLRMEVGTAYAVEDDSPSVPLRPRTPSQVEAQLARTQFASLKRQRQISGEDGKPSSYQFVPGYGMVFKTPVNLLAEERTRDRLEEIVQMYRLANRPETPQPELEPEPEPDASASSSEEEGKEQNPSVMAGAFMLRIRARRMVQEHLDRVPTELEMMTVAVSMLQVRLATAHTQTSPFSSITLDENLDFHRGL